MRVLPVMYNLIMKVRLTDRLSPRAKRAYLRGPAGERVPVLLSVSATANLSTLKKSLEALGGQVSSMSAETHVMGAVIPSEELPKIASMNEVTYVDATSPYTLSPRLVPVR